MKLELLTAGNEPLTSWSRGNQACHCAVTPAQLNLKNESSISVENYVLASNSCLNKASGSTIKKTPPEESLDVLHHITVAGSTPQEGVRFSPSISQ